MSLITLLELARGSSGWILGVFIAAMILRNTDNKSDQNHVMINRLISILSDPEVSLPFSGSIVQKLHKDSREDNSLLDKLL